MLGSELSNIFFYSCILKIFDKSKFLKNFINFAQAIRVDRKSEYTELRVINYLKALY